MIREKTKEGKTKTMNAKEFMEIVSENWRELSRQYPDPQHILNELASGEWVEINGNYYELII